MFVPLCIQLALFIFWNGWVIQHRNEDGTILGLDKTYMNRLCIVLVMVFCCYFILIELIQSTRDLKKYFTFGNLLDLAPNVLILMSCIKL